MLIKESEEVDSVGMIVNKERERGSVILVKNVRADYNV